MTGKALILGAVLIAAVANCSSGGELAVEDFKFDGPIGSQGATIEKLDRNHFKITLGHAPGHPGWANHLQFLILRNAEGNDLRITAVFVGETEYAFTGNFSAWSYDGIDWQPYRGYNTKTTVENNVTTRTATLPFPTFEKDAVWFGFQIPMSYEDLKI